jgi:cytochrome c biogenesis protein
MHPYRPVGLEDALAAPPQVGEQPHPEEPPALPELGWRGWVRWTWRQLASMRVALLLLMLLAVAALPGSFLPQRPQAPERVVQYLEDNPGVGPWLDRLGFFDVYASPWFSAIYLTLFVSLVGCILPRTAAHLRALRADPPRVPRSFDRFPTRAELVVEAPPEVVQAAALGALRGRYRARPGSEGLTRTVRAERGYLRETGNLLFHLALVGVLVGVALGELFGYRGQVVVVEDRGFANAVVAYDSFDAGLWFQDAALEPFTLRLEEFEAVFDPATLQPRDFTAGVTVEEPGSPPRPASIKVNHPLHVGGARVYLSGNGYAPALTVRDGAGEVAFTGPVPFLPQDGVYTSRGVVKVPDVSAGGPQLGLVGFLLPTGVVEEGGARSLFPQPLDPLLVLDAYAGDLGLDDGVPQNVYELDTSGMSVVSSTGVVDGDDPDAEQLTILLRPGETVALPDGLGSVTFEGLSRFVALDLRHDPMVGSVLVFALLAVGGLGLSLFVPRRRLWLRLTPTPDGRTVVAAAALARGEDPGLRGDLERVLVDVRSAASTSSSPQGDRPAAPSPGESR